MVRGEQGLSRARLRLIQSHVTAPLTYGCSLLYTTYVITGVVRGEQGLLRREAEGGGRRGERDMACLRTQSEVSFDLRELGATVGERAEQFALLLELCGLAPHAPPSVLPADTDDATCLFRWETCDTRVECLTNPFAPQPVGGDTFTFEPPSACFYSLTTVLVDSRTGSVCSLAVAAFVAAAIAVATVAESPAAVTSASITLAADAEPPTAVAVAPEPSTTCTTASGPSAAAAAAAEPAAAHGTPHLRRGRQHQRLCRHL